MLALGLNDPYVSFHKANCDMVTQLPKNKITIGTTFSGIGATEEAMRRLNINHEVLFACDIDKHAKAAYLANNSIDPKNFFDDIAQMDVSNFCDKVDLYVGGSPCQSFSTYGKQLGLNDNRGNLFFHYIKIIKQAFPKYFIWENVSSVITNDKGRSWKIIKSEFHELTKGEDISKKYDIQFININPIEIGFPQNRSRIFVIGSRKDNLRQLSISKPIHQKLKFKAIDLLEKDKNIFEKFPPIKKKKLAFVTSPKCDKNGYTRVHNLFSSHQNNGVFACQTARQITNWHGNFVYHPLNSEEEGSFQSSEVFSTRHISEEQWSEYIKVESNRKMFIKFLKEMQSDSENSGLQLRFKPSKSIDDLKNMAEPLSKFLWNKYNGKIKFGPHGIIRPTTPRENLTLMGFGQNFKIVTSDTQVYKQSGNSMVVDVLVHLYEQIFDLKKSPSQNIIKAIKIDTDTTISLL